MRKINLKEMLDSPPFQGWEELYNSFAKEFNKAPDKLTFFSSIQSLKINSVNKLERLESMYEKNSERLYKTLDQIHIFTANGEHDFHFNNGIEASKEFIEKLKKNLKYLLHWYQGESIPLPLKEIESEAFKEYRENHPWAFDAIDEAHEALEQIYELYNISDSGIQGEIRNCLANVVLPAYGIKSERILEQVASEIYSQIRKKGFDNEIKPYEQLSEKEKRDIQNRNRPGNPNYEKEWEFSGEFLIKAKELTDKDQYDQKSIYSDLIDEFYSDSDKEPSFTTVYRELKKKKIW